MTELLLGPVIRHVGEHDAAVWVETSGACEVDVLGHRERTFHVEGRHYALVEVAGLASGTEHEYAVTLDGVHAWPPPDWDFPPPVLRTWAPGDVFRILVGSCHQAAPHRPPWNRPSADNGRGSGADALHGWTRRMLAGDVPRPDALLLLGDQVYADQTHPEVAEELTRRRGHPPRARRPPVASFEEYAWLYHEAWSVPLMRWLLSTMPVFMVFDDHDVIDDWNTSQAWRGRVERLPWWPDRIQGALMSYWIYQHLGNVGTREPQDVELLDRMRAAGDGGPVLREFARRADAGTPDTAGHRWSFCRDIGPARLVVVDCRNGRVLEEGRRSMLDSAEWSWLEAQLRGDVTHLLLGTSLPWLLPRPIHDLEAWDEQLAAGAWGRIGARAGEWLRQAVDLEHWAAFGDSFTRLSDLVRDVAAGRRGAAPATVLALSGDVHFAYVAEPDLDGAQSRVRQVVTSPIRQAVPLGERRAQGAIMRKPLSLLPRGLVATTSAVRPPFDWRVTDGPCFDNNIALLTLAGPTAHLNLYVAALDEAGRPTVRARFDRAL